MSGPYKFDNNKLKIEGLVALDVVDKAYIGTVHGKYYSSHIQMIRSQGIGYNFVEADSVKGGVIHALNFARKRVLKVLRLRFVGHGTVGMIFLGANVEEVPGKFLKWEKGALTNGEHLKQLASVMAGKGWVELRGCNVLKGYEEPEEPSLFEKVGKKIGLLDDKKVPPHPGAEMIKAMARLIGNPVRAADDVNNAAGFEGWRGQVYEASPSGTIRSVAAP